MAKKIITFTLLFALGLAACTTAPIQVQEVVETPQSSNVYEDKSLSFEYPDGMSLLYSLSAEGYPLETLEWIAQSDDGDYYHQIGFSSTQLEYPYYLKAAGYESWDELKESKLSDGDDTFTINGQEAFLTIVSSFCAQEYSFYAEGPEGTVYHISAACLNEEAWNLLFDTFIDSVEFKK